MRYQRGEGRLFRDPTAEITLNFTPQTTEQWWITVYVKVMNQPVGAGEAKVEVKETTWWQPFKHNYGPIYTDSNGVAKIGPVAGAYYSCPLPGWCILVAPIEYDVIATLLVDKGPFKTGTQTKKHIVIKDGEWSDPQLYYRTVRVPITIRRF
jgi:hypothetical protein